MLEFAWDYLLGLFYVVMFAVSLFILNRGYGLYLGGAVIGVYTFPIFITVTGAVMIVKKLRSIVKNLSYKWRTTD
jgi:hypothetical protein